MSDIQDVKFGMRENDDLHVVEFGPVVNGVLHPLGQIRKGDYEEAQSAGEQAIADEKAASKGKK
jgi:hypothetical protein